MEYSSIRRVYLYTVYLSNGGGLHASQEGSSDSQYVLLAIKVLLESCFIFLYAVKQNSSVKEVGKVLNPT